MPLTATGLPLPATSIPAARKAKVRIPSLDGLRAVSIVLVVLGHAVHTMPAELRENPAMRLAARGSFGVAVFFVISGFLITHLLVVEQERHGRISLGAFYFRRGFRTFPAFYAFYLFALLLNYFDYIHASGWDFLTAGTFTWNYTLDHPVWALGHTWSLCVQEQFYLLWPLCFLMLGPKRSALLAGAIVLASPLVRLGTYELFPALRPFVPIMLHTRADTLMLGCLAALLYNKPRFQSWLATICRAPVVVGCLIFALVISPLVELEFHGTYQLLAGYSLESLCIVIAVLWCVRNERTAVGRFLNHPWVVFVGVLSYSIYLWQQPFLSTDPTWITKFPLNIVLAISFALACHFLVERPALRLRERISKSKPSPSAPGVLRMPQHNLTTARPGD